MHSFCSSIRFVAAHSIGWAGIHVMPAAGKRKKGDKAKGGGVRSKAAKARRKAKARARKKAKREGGVGGVAAAAAAGGGEGLAAAAAAGGPAPKRGNPKGHKAARLAAKLLEARKAKGAGP